MRLLWTFALLASTGSAASQTAHAANSRPAHRGNRGVSFAIVRGSGGMGLDLVIRNSTEGSLCIPVASLSADSGSLLAHQGPRLFASQRNEEYPQGYPGTGSFYIASKRTIARFALDEGGMKLAPGTYTFQVQVDWLDCAKLSSEKSYTEDQFTRRTVTGKLDYTPFK